MSNHGDDDEVAATVKADDVLVDRSCIGCDNCGVASPQKCCARGVVCFIIAGKYYGALL